jgi:hypothetical protein
MSWKVLNMTHKTNDGFVIETISAYEKTDGAGYSRRVFKTEFTESTTDFIPYEDLTEELVVGWVKDSLGSELVSETEALVDAECEAIKEAIEKPITQEGKPWKSDEIEIPEEGKE